MANYSSVPISFPEANHYADLEGIKQDLSWVIEASKKYKEINIRDIITREAFTFALISKYGRANLRGKRKHIPRGWIEELSCDEKKDHKYFMAIRGKYVGHSANDFEENYTKVFIKNISSEHLEFDQVSVSHIRISSISIDDVERLCNLSKKIIKKIESMMRVKRIKVEEIAKKIPIDELVKYKHTEQFLSGKNNPFEDRARKIIKS